MKTTSDETKVKTIISCRRMRAMVRSADYARKPEQVNEDDSHRQQGNEDDRMVDSLMGSKGARGRERNMERRGKGVEREEKA